MISDLGLDTVDLNGNGKIDYVMVEGDPENVDAQYRTEYSVKALEDQDLKLTAYLIRLVTGSRIRHSRS